MILSGTTFQWPIQPQSASTASAVAAAAAAAAVANGTMSHPAASSAYMNMWHTAFLRHHIHRIVSPPLSSSSSSTDLSSSLNGGGNPAPSSHESGAATDKSFKWRHKTSLTTDESYWWRHKSHSKKIIRKIRRLIFLVTKKIVQKELDQMMTSREFLFRCMTSPRIKCVFCCQSCNSKKNHFDCQNLKPKSLPCIRILETLIRKMTIIIINYNWLFVLSCDNNLCHHFFGLQQKNIKWSHLRLIIMKVLNFSWPSEKQTNVLWFNYFDVFFCIMTDFEMVQCIHSYFNFSWKKKLFEKNWFYEVHQI